MISQQLMMLMMLFIMVMLQSMFISLLVAQQNLTHLAHNSNSGRQGSTQALKATILQLVMCKVMILQIMASLCLLIFTQATKQMQSQTLMPAKLYIKLKAFQLSQQALQAIKQLKKSSSTAAYGSKATGRTQLTNSSQTFVTLWQILQRFILTHIKQA